MSPPAFPSLSTFTEEMGASGEGRAALRGSSCSSSELSISMSNPSLSGATLCGAVGVPSNKWLWYTGGVTGTGESPYGCADLQI